MLYNTPDIPSYSMLEKSSTHSVDIDELAPGEDPLPNPCTRTQTLDRNQRVTTQPRWPSTTKTVRTGKNPSEEASNDIRDARTTKSQPSSH